MFKTEHFCQDALAYLKKRKQWNSSPKNVSSDIQNSVKKTCSYEEALYSSKSWPSYEQDTSKKLYFTK